MKMVIFLGDGAFMALLYPHELMSNGVKPRVIIAIGNPPFSARSPLRSLYVMLPIYPSFYCYIEFMVAFPIVYRL